MPALSVHRLSGGSESCRPSASQRSVSALRRPELAATPPAMATLRRPSPAAHATVFSTSWFTIAAWYEAAMSARCASTSASSRPRRS